MFRIFTTFLFSVFIFFSSQSQEYGLIKKLDLSFGLPTETVYASVIDKENYVWICTDNGIVKYNGSHLKLFTTRNGLPSNDIFNIYVDSQNRKWLMGFFSGIYYLKNDKIYKIPNSNFINDTKSIFEDNNVLYFVSSEKTYKLFLSSGKFQEIKSIAGTIVMGINPKEKPFWVLHTIVL